MDTLREYLRLEYQTRLKSVARFTREAAQEFSPEVPQQTNSCDCGVYLLHYIELVFKNPSFFRFPAKLDQGELQDWFCEGEIQHKREEIAALIQGMAAKNVAFPQLRFMERRNRYEKDIRKEIGYFESNLSWIFRRRRKINDESEDSSSNKKTPPTSENGEATAEDGGVASRKSRRTAASAAAKSIKAAAATEEAAEGDEAEPEAEAARRRVAAEAARANRRRAADDNKRLADAAAEAESPADAAQRIMAASGKFDDVIKPSRYFKNTTLPHRNLLTYLKNPFSSGAAAVRPRPRPQDKRTRTSCPRRTTPLLALPLPLPLPSLRHRLALLFRPRLHSLRPFRTMQPRSSSRRRRRRGGT